MGFLELGTYRAGWTVSLRACFCRYDSNYSKTVNIREGLYAKGE